MSGETTIKLPAGTVPEPLKRAEDGKLLFAHIAEGSYVDIGGRSGELLLCGTFLMYDEVTDSTPGAKMCPECEENEG